MVAEALAVEEDVAGVVHAAKAETHSLPSLHLWRQDKLLAIDPIPLRNPLARPTIAPELRGRDLSRIPQVRRHIAGHDGRNPGWRRRLDAVEVYSSLANAPPDPLRWRQSHYLPIRAVEAKRRAHVVLLPAGLHSRTGWCSGVQFPPQSDFPCCNAPLFASPCARANPSGRRGHVDSWRGGHPGAGLLRYHPQMSERWRNP